MVVIVEIARIYDMDSAGVQTTQIILERGVDIAIEIFFWIFAIVLKCCNLGSFWGHR
jgi:hypothetical protein